jgi:hypothetical protein
MLHITYCTLHITYCILHNTYCILHITCCILHITCCILHITYCILDNTLCILYTAYYILHTVYYILHTVYRYYILNITSCKLCTYYILHITYYIQHITYYISYIIYYIYQEYILAIIPSLTCTRQCEEYGSINQGVYSVMGTHSFIRYIVTITVTLLVTTITNKHLQ